MNKLSAKQKAFYKEVANILWNKWDPIGVNDGENDWNDEYDCYVPHVFRLAIENKDAIKIAGFLSSAVTQNMGMNPVKDHDLNIAKVIVKTKQEILR